MAGSCSWFGRLCRWRFASILASATVVTTLITCFIITQAKHRYTGGLAWPYFSDMGRDAPSYYVFGVGLTLVAIAIALTWVFNYEYHRKRFASVALVVQPSPWAYCVSIAVLIIGVVSTVGLPLLSWCSTTSCPLTHEWATIWFFILELVAILLNTCLSYYIWKVLWIAYTTTDPRDQYHAHRGPDDLERGQRLARAMDVASSNVRGIKVAFYWQLVCSILLLATAIVYFPVGIAVVGSVPRLTVQQCLDRNLGLEYCTVTMRYDSVDTKLWNYELKPVANQLRAACQLAAMLSLVGYSLSFLFHDYSIVKSPGHTPTARTPLTSGCSRRGSH